VATPSPLSQNIAFVVCASQTTTHSPCSPPCILTHLAAHGSCALQGNDAPAPIRNFGELGALGLAPRAVQQVQSFGFAEPSPIQVSDETVVARPMRRSWPDPYCHVDLAVGRGQTYTWSYPHVVTHTRHTHTHTHTHTHIHTHTHTHTHDHAVLAVLSVLHFCSFVVGLLRCALACYSDCHFAPCRSHACHHSHNNDYTITP
jgi:hypothetical protein